ncbi:uncharacterized protein V6R79_023585 [Siganus canaliculatus]
MLSEGRRRRRCPEQQEQKGGARESSGRRRHRWAKTCRGRHWRRRRAQPRPQPPLHARATALRARGMRAPKNTNQFLMREKYQLLHMRTDSVGSDSGCSSDSDPELTDMDSYLGVLENARGALLDGSTTPPAGQDGGVRVQEGGVRVQEDSMQYFPSEDDLLQSHNFMQRDFVEFCDILTP